MSRRELDLNKLKQFKADTPHQPDDRFPSREPVDDTQLNIKLPQAEAARFRWMAKAERYKLGAFLTILMDAYDNDKA